MKQKPNANSKGKKSRPKTKLGIPDLEMSKAAVLRSLGSPDSRRGYQQNRLFGKWHAVALEQDLKAAKCTRYRLYVQVDAYKMPTNCFIGKVPSGLCPGLLTLRLLNPIATRQLQCMGND
jgi:hypothetical protein